MRLKVGGIEVRGPMPNAMQNVWKQIYGEWLPSSGYVQSGFNTVRVLYRSSSVQSGL